MTIQNLIDNTKEFDPDITGIKVSIQDKNVLTFFDNPTEIFFGELSDIPEDMLKYEVIETSRICASSVEERNGANVLICQQM